MASGAGALPAPEVPGAAAVAAERGERSSGGRAHVGLRHQPVRRPGGHQPLPGGRGDRATPFFPHPPSPPPLTEASLALMAPVPPRGEPGFSASRPPLPQEDAEAVAGARFVAVLKIIRRGTPSGLCCPAVGGTAGSLRGLVFNVL